MPCIDWKVVAVSPSQQVVIDGDPGTDPETMTSITSKCIEITEVSAFIVQDGHNLKAKFME